MTNIKVLFAGDYEILFDLSTHKIDITGTTTEPIPGEITISVRVTCDVGEGYMVLIAGEFNNWSSPLALEWTEGNVWVGEFKIHRSVGQTVEFKLLKGTGYMNTYENGSNRVYTVVDGENTIVITDGFRWQN